MKRQRRQKVALITALLSGGCLLGTGDCIPDNYLKGLISDTADDLGDFLMDALILEPFETAVDLTIEGMK